MNIRVGHGLLGKIKFNDGAFPEYPRPYLVVYVNKKKIGVLNVSSTKGKEHKLLFPTNLEIKKFNPPFLCHSFVKLDSLVYISLQEAKEMEILNNGKRIDKTELARIIKKLEQYN